MPLATNPHNANLKGVSPFSKVPLEILLRISPHLTTAGLCNLRLTCKSIEQALFNTFTREFFTKRQFMLTEYSLQALVDISKSRLSDCLDHVIIGLDSFDQRYPFPEDKMAANNTYVQAYADHVTLVSSGHDIVMLTEAFQNLRNLKTVGIRDYHSDARAGRDGDGATWASYGATTIFKQIGVNLAPAYNTRRGDPEYPDKVMVTLFTALGNAGARPKAFEILTKRNFVPGDIAFNLFTKYLKPRVLPVLEAIETLFLEFWHAVISVFYVDTPGRQTKSATDYLARQFLGYLPNLKHLRLNFRDRRHPPNELMTWLASPVSKTPLTPFTADTSLLTLPPPPVFPCLRELNLGLCRLDHTCIIQAVGKFAPTLKSLELYRVGLENRLGKPKMNLWAKVLKSLVQVPGLNLEHIMISLPLQYNHRVGMPVSGRRVVFQRKDAPKETLTREEYTGMDWKHYIGEMSTRVKLAPRDVRETIRPYVSFSDSDDYV